MPEDLDKPPWSLERVVFIANGDGTFMRGLIMNQDITQSRPMRQEFSMGDPTPMYAESRAQTEVSLTAMITDRRIILPSAKGAGTPAIEKSVEELVDKVNELSLSNEIPERDFLNIEAISDGLMKRIRVRRPADRSAAVPPRKEPPPPPPPPSDLAKRFGALEVDENE